MYCDECGYKNKESAKFCKKCGASLEEENNVKKEDIEKVLENEEFDDSLDKQKLAKKQLLEYLNIAKELEINKLALHNGITDLNKLDKQKYVEIVKPIKQKKKPHFNIVNIGSISGAFTLTCFLAIPIYIIVMFTYHKLYDQIYSKYFEWDTPSLFTSIPITLVICIVVCICLAIILLVIHNTVGRTKYNVEFKKYKKESNEIEEHNNMQLSKYESQKTIIDTRKKSIDSDLEDVEKTLDKLYSLDIIYIKYRNLVAVTTFIEYLESGRCKSLYGYTGCYNVYEQELRQNTIIGKLDQVLIQLDQIKKVQFATYLAIQQSNALQSSLLNTCNQMLDASTKEAALLEAQAQDNKIIKRNSEIISTISALNYIKN